MEQILTNDMKITHINEVDGAIIVNNGSCISYRIYKDYSGSIINSEDMKKMFKRNRHWKPI